MQDYHWRAEIQSLSSDTANGSQAVCLKATEIIIKTIDTLISDSSIENVNSLILELCGELERSKPAMAGLYTLSAQVARAMETAGNNQGDAASKARWAAQEYRSRLLSTGNLIAANALKLLPEKACVATISRSATVESVLKHGRDRGRVKRVLTSEGRPAYEGQISARVIAEEGIAVVFTADAALPSLVEQCDIIVVGGDALCPSGLVNKAGSFALALAARWYGRPFVVCLGSEKIIPFNIPEYYLKEDASILWNESPDRIRVVNRIFEFTPLDIIDHVVTEDGIISGDKIPEIFASIEINSYFRNWF